MTREQRAEQLMDKGPVWLVQRVIALEDERVVLLRGYRILAAMYPNDSDYAANEIAFKDSDD